VLKQYLCFFTAKMSKCTKKTVLQYRGCILVDSKDIVKRFQLCTPKLEELSNYESACYLNAS
jgi:hypothetical protein